jgi:hypothetical protein
MTDGDVSAREPSRAALPIPAEQQSLLDNLPGQTAIAAALRAQAELPPRSRFARAFGVSPLGSEARARYDAALSEIEVGEVLAGLPEGWVVLHALPVGVGASDIDHLVVGPGGVFIINTKNHPGQVVWVSQRAFLVAGIRYPYIRNMEYEMGRAERLLSAASSAAVEVSGILAVVAAKSITVRDKHRDVSVVPCAELADWLVERSPVLSPEQVDAIGRAAALESTWHVSGGPAVDRADLRSRFDRLRTDVRRAWRRQVAWATVATLIGAGGFNFVTFSILFTALSSLSG